jgi:UDP-N-acetylmuramyl pentapeptide synthase
MTTEAVMVFEEIAEMATRIMDLTSDGGSVLVKGSRGARMERVIEAMERHVKAPEPLEVSSVSLAL